MRILLGLETATSGSATVDGIPFVRLRDPLCRVGALLDARGAHHGRSAIPSSPFDQAALLVFRQRSV
jgi:ABC-2 type transport system ATP-binding protein